MFRTATILAGALVASSLVASSAQAAGWIVGLVDGKSIVTIDPASGAVLSSVGHSIFGALNGLEFDAGGTLLMFRPRSESGSGSKAVRGDR